MSYAGPMPARRTSALVVSLAFALTACGASGAPASAARYDGAVNVPQSELSQRKDEHRHKPKRQKRRRR